MTELYTMDKLVKDFKKGSNGLLSSRRKWASMLNNLLEISNQVGSYCGLCFDTLDEKGKHHCENCRFTAFFGKRCTEHCDFIEARNKIRAALTATLQMNLLLKEMESAYVVRGVEQMQSTISRVFNAEENAPSAEIEVIMNTFGKER